MLIVVMLLQNSKVL